MEEYKRVGQATDENMCMHIAWWIPKATDTHSGCVLLIAFSTAVMVARMHLNVMLHVHYFSYVFSIFCTVD